MHKLHSARLDPIEQPIMSAALVCDASTMLLGVRLAYRFEEAKAHRDDAEQSVALATGT